MMLKRMRRRLWIASVLPLAGWAGCTLSPLSSSLKSLQPSRPVATMSYRPSATSAPTAAPLARLPTPESVASGASAARGGSVQMAAFAERSPTVQAAASPADRIETLSTPPIGVGQVPLDLPRALAMTDEQNPQVALARERIEEAYAQLSRANVLWLPSLRAGVNYNKHEGQIQDVAGGVFPTSRGAFYGGLGANAVGAGSPSVPGVYANFHVADAYFQPRIADNVVAARQSSADSNTNDQLLQTALAYLELLRADQERAIARETVENTRKLAVIAAAYARSGQGLPADDDRVQTELALRENDVARADEAVRTASARLAQQVRIDPTLLIAPQEPSVTPLNLTAVDQPLNDLVANGLSNRPEVAENRHLVNEAIFRLRREQLAPLIPSVLLGVSYGGFGGGKGSSIDNFADRMDADAVAYWELRNLGLGERAARCEAQSRVEQARLRQVAMLDRVAREIVESHAQVQARLRTIATSERSIELATRSLERNLERIQNAEGLPLEVLQSIQAKSTAQREYLRAVTDYNVAQFQLLRAVGGTPYEMVPTLATRQ